MTNITNKFILFLLLICMLVVLFFYLKITSKTSEIYFSKESGFYDNDFELEIKGEGEIYYTLDGSIPTKQSNRYTGPIRITDASKNPNTNSMNKDVSPFFNISNPDPRFSDVPYLECMKYEIPNYLIDKCNVVRAVSFLKYGRKTDVISASYFVGFKEKEAYQDIGIISLITDPKNLFDKKNGIYVMGEKLKDFNFSIKGNKSERIAHIDIFNQNRDLILQEKVGIRVHGNTTRFFTPKSLNIYFRYKSDKTNNFYGSIIDEDYNPKVLTLLYPLPDDTKIKDFLIMSLCNNKNVATMKFKPYLLFLDGEYWGFYYLTEKYDIDFISYHYKIKNRNNIIVAKAKDKIFSKFEDVISFIKSREFSGENGEKNYGTLCSMIDIDSFIKYIAVLVYSGSDDILDMNYGVWKTTKKIDNEYQNAKLRFMLYDFDNICGEVAYDMDYLLPYATFNLMGNKLFKEKLYNELINLSKTDFNPTVVEKFIKRNREYIKKYVINDYKRFYGMLKEEGESYFEKGINEVMLFFRNRPKTILKYCNENKFIDKQYRKEDNN